MANRPRHLARPAQRPRGSRHSRPLDPLTVAFLALTGLLVLGAVAVGLALRPDDGGADDPAAEQGSVGTEPSPAIGDPPGAGTDPTTGGTGQGGTAEDPATSSGKTTTSLPRGAVELAADGFEAGPAGWRATGTGTLRLAGPGHDSPTAAELRRRPGTDTEPGDGPPREGERTRPRPDGGGGPALTAPARAAPREASTVHLTVWAQATEPGAAITLRIQEAAPAGGRAAGTEATFPLPGTGWREVAVTHPVAAGGGHRLTVEITAGLPGGAALRLDDVRLLALPARQPDRAGRKAVE